MNTIRRVQHQLKMLKEELVYCSELSEQKRLEKKIKEREQFLNKIK